MRVVVQRVSEAFVEVEGEVIGSIAKGLMVLLGVEDEDESSDVEWLVGKISKMRIFEDKEGKMNLSLLDIGGEVLVVSQFTLHASTKKGNRPSFTKSARPDKSKPLYEKFVSYMAEQTGKPCATGEFGANMQVSLVNDGPVTIIMDSKEKQ